MNNQISFSIVATVSLFLTYHFGVTAEYNFNVCTNGTLFPHPTNCSEYLKCEQNNLVVHPCPQGLHYNPKVLNCTSPQSANCTGTSTTIRPMPTTTTTYRPTTRHTTTTTRRPTTTTRRTTKRKRVAPTEPSASNVKLILILDGYRKN